MTSFHVAGHICVSTHQHPHLASPYVQSRQSGGQRPPQEARWSSCSVGEPNVPLPAPTSPFHGLPEPTRAYHGLPEAYQPPTRAYQGLPEPTRGLPAPTTAYQGPLARAIKNKCLFNMTYQSLPGPTTTAFLGLQPTAGSTRRGTPRHPARCYRCSQKVSMVLMLEDERHRTNPSEGINGIDLQIRATEIRSVRRGSFY